MKVLVSDSLAEEGVKRLQSGADVDVITNLSPEELIETIKNYDALVIRSGTKVTADVIKAADRLKVIGSKTRTTRARCYGTTNTRSA